MEPKTHKTAVVIIPPAELWPPIQAVRQQHDRNFRRWMPHITLLYPFRAVAEFPALAAQFREVLRGLRPFAVQLSEIRYFTHGQRSTLWLAPEPAAPLIELQHTLQGVVPDCDDVRRFAQGFTPHLSIAQAPNPTRRNHLLTTLQQTWQPLSFTVAAVQLIARNDPPDDVFRAVTSVPLGE